MPCLRRHVQGWPELIQGKGQKRDFVCSDCGRTWQVPFGSERPGRCPHCGHGQLHRLNPGGHGRGPSRFLPKGG